GRAEVENLCGQIGRLECEFGARVALPQTRAEHAPVLPHRRLFILQQDRQITILRADGRRRDEGEVMRSDRQAAITDDVFDLTGQQLLDGVGDQRGKASTPRCVSRAAPAYASE